MIKNKKIISSLLILVFCLTSCSFFKNSSKDKTVGSLDVDSNITTNKDEKEKNLIEESVTDIPKIEDEYKDDVKFDNDKKLTNEEIIKITTNILKKIHNAKVVDLKKRNFVISELKKLGISLVNDDVLSEEIFKKAGKKEVLTTYMRNEPEITNDGNNIYKIHFDFQAGFSFIYDNESKLRKGVDIQKILKKEKDNHKLQVTYIVDLNNKTLDIVNNQWRK